MINPKWREARAQGYSTHNLEKYVTMFNEHEDGWFSIPRGIEETAFNFVNKEFPGTKFTDETKENIPIKYECNITPHDFQVPAINAALKSYCGVLSLPTGGGKTIIALYLIFMRKQKTFIIVHTKDLLYQWQDRIKTFLNYDCGLVGDNKFKIKDITVGIVQSVKNKSLKSNFAADFGYLIVDECHRTPSSTFVDACGHFQAAYITGLSATPYRRDGLDNFIFWTLGNLIYDMPKKELVKEGKIIKPKVIITETEILFGQLSNGDVDSTYTTLIKELKTSDERNNMIASDIDEAFLENFSCCLVLSDHKTHLNNISKKIRHKHTILTSGSKGRKKIVKDIIDGKIRILLATAPLIGEGFDYDGFTHLFTAMPIGYVGRLEQFIGRLVRAKNGKNVVKIYEYVDKNPIFHKQLKRRIKIYNSY
jgi:superfamily II DNA or RNA helicase